MSERKLNDEELEDVAGGDVFDGKGAYKYDDRIYYCVSWKVVDIAARKKYEITDAQMLDGVPQYFLKGVGDATGEDPGWTTQEDIFYSIKKFGVYLERL